MERRRSQRHKSFIRGLVYFDNIPTPADCLVRDFSELGARIKFETLPPAFANSLELYLPTKGQKLRGEVRWRKGDEIGLSFRAGASSGNQSLDDRVNRLEAEIATLKQLLKKLQRSHEETARVA